MIEIFPDKDPYTTRQLLKACLETSNLRASLQSGETADRRLSASKLFNHGARNKRRENALASSEAARLHATPQMKSLREDLRRITTKHPPRVIPVPQSTLYPLALFPQNV